MHRMPPTLYHTGKLQGNPYEVWQQAFVDENDKLDYDYFYRLGTEGDLIPVPEDDNDAGAAKKFAYAALKKSIGHVTAEARPTGVRADGTLTTREELRLRILFDRDGSKEIKEKLDANTKLVEKLAKERAAAKAEAAKKGS